MLSDCAHVLRTIGNALVQRGSSYAAVFGALLTVAQEPGLDETKASAPARETLDEDWAEAPAFAPADAGQAAQVSPIRFMSRKPQP